MRSKNDRPKSRSDREIGRITFQKPDLTLLREGHVVFDMHFHTSYTDGRASVDQIAVQARTLGIGVAITDHNDIRGALELSRKKDVLSIPGIEVTSREGSHVLVYFYDVADLSRFYNQLIRPALGPSLMSSTRLCMEDIMGAASGFNALKVFPHPFCAVYTGICNHHFEPAHLSRLLRAADAIEAINGENMRRWNRQSAGLIKDMGKPATGGSDGHSIFALGKVVTVAACEPSGPAFLDALKGGNTRVIGREINLLRKAASGGAKLKVGFSRYPELLQKNINYSYRVLHVKSRAFKAHLRSNLLGDWGEHL